MNMLAAIPAIHSAMATVDCPAEPAKPSLDDPMTFGFRTNIISKAITGAASTPLMTALQ